MNQKDSRDMSCCEQAEEAERGVKDRDRSASSKRRKKGDAHVEWEGGMVELVVKAPVGCFGLSSSSSFFLGLRSSETQTVGSVIDRRKRSGQARVDWMLPNQSLILNLFYSLVLVRLDPSQRHERPRE